MLSLSSVPHNAARTCTIWDADGRINIVCNFNKYYQNWTGRNPHSEWKLDINYATYTIYIFVQYTNKRKYILCSRKEVDH